MDPGHEHFEPNFEFEVILLLDVKGKIVCTHTNIVPDTVLHDSLQKQIWFLHVIHNNYFIS
jgi:hypothetical protein